MKRKPLLLGCTAARHAELGIDAVVNARGGRGHDLNNPTHQEIEAQRDANRVRDRITHRVRVYQYCSRSFRRAPADVQALLSDYRESES
jgi:hypothetical protein